MIIAGIYLSQKAILAQFLFLNTWVICTAPSLSRDNKTFAESLGVGILAKQMHSGRNSEKG